MNSQELRNIDAELTMKLKNMKDEALEIYNDMNEEYGYDSNKSLHSMHAIIGSKNNTYVDSVRTKFASPSDFIRLWVSGLIEANSKPVFTRGGKRKKKLILISLLQDDFFRDYAFAFLERNFYRNLKARTRDKPDDILWELWIGNNIATYGVLMTPVFRNGKWTNDVSEIRRADYNYWTVGHIMETGFVDPDEKEKIMFNTNEDFFTFYRSTLKKLSNSKYEKEIFTRYISYLKNSNNIEDEPILIPEIRYAGLKKEHKYRLDFTILNSHTQEYIGFELSPSSSHMAVSGIKSGKTQTEMNEDLKIKWNKEMKKRNDYFSEFGITIVTFSDKDLENMDEVFDGIKKFLLKREPNKKSLRLELEELLKI